MPLRKRNYVFRIPTRFLLTEHRDFFKYTTNVHVHLDYRMNWLDFEGSKILFCTTNKKFPGKISQIGWQSVLMTCYIHKVNGKLDCYMFIFFRNIF